MRWRRTRRSRHSHGDGLELTHLLVVEDVQRSKTFYTEALGAEVHREYGGTSVDPSLPGDLASAGHRRRADGGQAGRAFARRPTRERESQNDHPRVPDVPSGRVQAIAIARGVEFLSASRGVRLGDPLLSSRSRRSPHRAQRGAAARPGERAAHEPPEGEGRSRETGAIRSAKGRPRHALGHAVPVPAGTSVARPARFHRRRRKPCRDERREQPDRLLLRTTSRGDYATTRISSERLVSPARTFRTPSSRTDSTPLARAASRSSRTGTPRSIMSPISSSIASTS